MKPDTLGKRAAALLMSATLVFSAAFASAPGVPVELDNQLAPWSQSSAESGGFVTLASKSTAKQKAEAKRRAAARRRAAAKRKAAAKRRAAKRRAAARRRANARYKAATKRINRLITLSKSKLGKRYESEAVGPNTFDCSGFTLYAYRSVGISLNHYAKSQGYGRGGRVSLSKLRRGDLVFFNTSQTSGSARYHVGIYLGGGSFIHASSSAKKVVINSVNYGFYRSAFLWGKRLF